MTASFCYVILAHTDPAGLRRLVARIRALSPQAKILVRHEDPALIDAATLAPYGAIDLVSRVPVRWGSWTMVTAMLEAYDAAIRLTDADYITLISGQDYPIRDLGQWEAELGESGTDLVLDPMYAKPHTYRRHFLTFRLPGPRTIPKRAVHWCMDRIGRISEPRFQLYRMERTGPDLWWFSMPRRGQEEPPDWFVKASQWMTMRRDVVEGVLASAGPKARGWRHMRTLLIPDEIAVQSAASALATRVLTAPTSAMNFEEHAPSPDWLTPELVRSLARETPAPFARKMPVQGWEAVVAAADALTTRPDGAPEDAAPAADPSAQERAGAGVPEPETAADRAATRPGRRPTGRGARPAARNR